MRGSVDGAAEAVCFELFTSISLIRSGGGCVDDFCAPTAGSRLLRRHCGLFFGVVPLGSVKLRLRGTEEVGNL